MNREDRATPPPSFPVELKNHEMEVSLRRETEHKIDKVLQETFSNHMLVGKGGFRSVTRFWEPHNYRLYFDFNRTSMNHSQVWFSSKNYNSEFSSKTLIQGCRVIIKKKTVEIINLNYPNKWFRVQAKSMAEIDERVIEIINHLDSQCIDALKETIRLCGGFSRFELIKRHTAIENGYKGDKYIDNVPAHIDYIDFPYSKKVYADKTEIYNVMNVRQKLRNDLVKDNFTEIKEELEKHRFFHNKLNYLKEKIKCVDDVFKYKDMILTLPKREAAMLGDFLFKLNEVDIFVS